MSHYRDKIFNQRNGLCYAPTFNEKIETCIKNLSNSFTNLEFRLYNYLTNLTTIGGPWYFW